jgi:uncharacterized protein YbjT (DUF2867 family)
MGLHAVVGVSGNTGGAAARALMRRGARVRAIVHDHARGDAWAARGAEVAVADLADAATLAAAFQDADAVYVLNPPAYTMPDIFARAEVLVRSLFEAARRARPGHLVVLSSIGAHLASGHGNIRTNSTFEQVLAGWGGPVTFLRPAYFMENWAWVAAAAAQGVLPSFLSPASRAIPMVSAEDIGERAAQAMLEPAAGARVVELAGPRECSPDDVAAAFTKALGRPVSVAVVPESEWPAALAASHFSSRTIESWMEMFRGFNSGAIGFERPGSPPERGHVSIQDAVGAIVRRT